MKIEQIVAETLERHEDDWINVLVYQGIGIGTDEMAEAVVAALREAGMLVEPEWEYGVSCAAFREEEPEPHPTLESAEHVRDHTETIYRKWTHGSKVTLHRRTKPGPWIEVPSE